MCNQVDIVGNLSRLCWTRTGGATYSRKRTIRLLSLDWQGIRITVWECVVVVDLLSCGGTRDKTCDRKLGVKSSLLADWRGS